MNVVVKLKPRTPSYRIYALMLIESLTELSVGGSIADRMLGAGVTENPIAKMSTTVYYRRAVGQSCREGDVFACLCNTISAEHEKIKEIIPYIPGSTLKGLLRSIAENISKADSRYCTFGELLENLAKVFSNERDTSQVVDEILEKLVLKILEQFIDEELAKGVVNSLQGRIRRKKVYEALREFKENPALVLDQNRFGRGYVENLSAILKSIFDLPVVYHNVCNPVIEGLACELPLPRFKLRILQAIAACLGDNVVYPCRVCRLFGLPGYASRVYVTSAYPVSLKNLFITYRLHIAIDRLRGSVATGRTFDIEMIAPGAKFAFMVSYDVTLDPRSNVSCLKLRDANDNDDSDLGVIRALENIRIGDKKLVEIDDEYKLFVDTLEEAVKEAQWLGRRKTIGLGMVKIRPLFTAVHNLATNEFRVISVNAELMREFSSLLQFGVPSPIRDILTYTCMLYRGGVAT